MAHRYRVNGTQAQRQTAPVEPRAGNDLEEPHEGSLLPDVYQNLHAIACARMLEVRSEHTLHATALVPEAWFWMSKREGGVAGIP